MSDLVEEVKNYLLMDFRSDEVYINGKKYIFLESYKLCGCDIRNSIDDKPFAYCVECKKQRGRCEGGWREY